MTLPAGLRVATDKLHSEFKLSVIYSLLKSPDGTDRRTDGVQSIMRLVSGGSHNREYRHNVGW